MLQIKIKLITVGSGVGSGVGGNVGGGVGLGVTGCC